MTTRFELSPVTRIEGHLSVSTEVEVTGGVSGKPTLRIGRARCHGEMFRGFEALLQGRQPLDAQQIVQRICGVCPISHGLASVKAQEMAYGIKPSPNGRLMQNLILAADTLQGHLLHFYHFFALDFVDVKAVAGYAGQDPAMRRFRDWVSRALAHSKEGLEPYPAAPFLPRQEARYLADRDVNCTLLAHYAEAMEMRRLAHEMGAVFAARMPHSTSIVPGGCTQSVREEGIARYRARLERVRSFVEGVLLSDVAALARAFPQYWEIGRGYGHMLCYGSFELNDAGDKFLGPGVLIHGKWEPLNPEAIAEDVGCSWLLEPSKLHPSRGQTRPAPHKPHAYSWLKAPRYKGLPMEVGPLARILVNYGGPKPWPGKQEVDKMLGLLGVGVDKLISVFGRVACRALETVLIARQAARWLDQLEPNGPPARDFTPARNASGYGLVEAPRGALGHWLSIEGGRIQHYQCVVPTTWNCSPRDDAGQPGPLEKALEGLELADPEQPVEAGRVVRSFDPCMACAVH